MQAVHSDCSWSYCLHRGEHARNIQGYLPAPTWWRSSCQHLWKCQSAQGVCPPQRLPENWSQSALNSHNGCAPVGITCSTQCLLMKCQQWQQQNKHDDGQRKGWSYKALFIWAQTYCKEQSIPCTTKRHHASIYGVAASYRKWVPSS